MVEDRQRPDALCEALREPADAEHQADGVPGDRALRARARPWSRTQRAWTCGRGHGGRGRLARRSPGRAARDTAAGRSTRPRSGAGPGERRRQRVGTGVCGVCRRTLVTISVSLARSGRSRGQVLDIRSAYDPKRRTPPWDESSESGSAGTLSPHFRSDRGASRALARPEAELSVVNQRVDAQRRTPPKRRHSTARTPHHLYPFIAAVSTRSVPSSDRRSERNAHSPKQQSVRQRRRHRRGDHLAHRHARDPRRRQHALPSRSS
jgi:hypothetical protein